MGARAIDRAHVDHHATSDFRDIFVTVASTMLHRLEASAVISSAAWSLARLAISR
jgi:hypothetical protein